MSLLDVANKLDESGFDPNKGKEAILNYEVLKENLMLQETRTS